jgi:fatty-acyl-CoA synthase
MNVGEWIVKRARRNPDGPFLKEEEGVDRAFTNRQFNERVNRMAHTLLGMGVVKGDRVATLLLNSSEFLEIFFASAKIGVIIVPVNFRLAVPELSYIIEDADPKMVFYSSDFYEKVESLKSINRRVPVWIKHGGEEILDDQHIADLIDDAPADEPPGVDAVVEYDPLLIMYTSGTTGDPKGAVLSHRAITFDAIHNLINYGLNNTFKSLVSTPLFHIGSLAASTTPVIYAGGSLVLKRFFNASEVVKLISTEKINYMFTVPVVYQMMTEAAEWEGADFSHVHYFFSGGAPMPVPLIKKYQEEKGVSFAQGYGMTEACQITAVPLADSITKAGSVGKEGFHTSLRIVDENDADVSQGDTGEVIIRGPNLFSGYWKKPEETTAAFTGDWFRTGDMGYWDEDGYIFLVGRKVEMIISSGMNIYPAEVERAIQAQPEVAEAAAVGVPDSRRGEVVSAYVRLEKGKEISEEELIKRLTGMIASFKIPKKFFFVDDFPRNQGGKILKRELKERYRQATEEK